MNKFNVIIPVYNAELWIGRCIESIVLQDYAYFDLLVIDDCSTDHTSEIVKSYNVYSIRNGERKGALANIVKGINLIGKDIIITVDGDDYLADNKVFSYLNDVYTSDIWMTYGSFLPVSGRYKNTCQPFDKMMTPCEAGYLVEVSVTPQTYRKSGFWVTSHLRTFRKWLWDKINDEDLRDENGYYMTASELSYMYPMIEMAGNHIRFIEKILYIYNDLNPNCDGTINSQLQISTSQKIQAKPMYKTL